MIHSSGNKTPPPGPPTIAVRKPTYSRVFRWQLPAGETHQPRTVEIIGTMTQWEKVPLSHEPKTNGWHVTLHNIPSYKTHHYMLLADGKPVPDKNSDGLAIPHGAQEEQYALAGARGPRLYMLFAQTK